MPLGKDTQYDETWEEQDRMRRRREIRARLKNEYIRRTYDPMSSIRGEYVNDPAIDRWMIMRKELIFPKEGLSLRTWLRTWAWLTLPMFIYGGITYYNNRDYEEKCRSGEIPYEAREWKWKL